MRGKYVNTWVCGCFLKWLYPQILQFDRVFHYKPSILEYPYFWKHPCGNIPKYQPRGPPMRVERELGYPSQKLSSIDFCRISSIWPGFYRSKVSTKSLFFFPKKWWNMPKFPKTLGKLQQPTKDLYYFNLTYEGGSVDCSQYISSRSNLRYKKISAVENSIASMTSEALLAELRKNDQPRKGKKARPGQFTKTLKSDVLKCWKSRSC